MLLNYKLEMGNYSRYIHCFLCWQSSGLFINFLFLSIVALVSLFDPFCSKYSLALMGFLYLVTTLFVKYDLKEF